MNNKLIRVTVAVAIGIAFGAEAGWLDSVAEGVDSVTKTVSQAAETGTRLQSAVSGKGLDTPEVKGVQSSISPQAESRDVTVAAGKTMRLGHDERQENIVQDSRPRTPVTSTSQDRQAEALRERGVIPAEEVKSANKLLMDDIDQFLNGEFSNDVVATFPGQQKDQILETIIRYVVDKDRTLGIVSLSRSGTPSAGFRDANGAVEGLGLMLGTSCYDVNEAKRISRAWVEYAKTWLALRKAAIPMSDFLNGDFKRRLQDMEKAKLQLDGKYAVRFQGDSVALSEYVKELNRKFDPKQTVFMSQETKYEEPSDVRVYVDESDKPTRSEFDFVTAGRQDEYSDALWINPNITDPKVIADGIVAWKQKFDEFMKPVEEQIAAALKCAADDERAFAAFVQSVGQQASGSTNAFVGVEVYKGVRLGMTESDFHKIVPSPCSDAQWDAKNRFGKALRYPSIKKNTIVPSDGSIGAVDIYFGGPDLKEELDESRKNYIVTRVVFTINNAASVPGIEAVEKQFAKRFGDDVMVERSAREMPRGFSDAAGRDPKVQAIYAKIAKYEKKAEQYKLTGTVPPQKFIEEVKAVQDEFKSATAKYAIVEKYPVIRLSCAGQVVVLTQPDLTRNVEVTAFYEEAESQLSSLRLSLTDKALKKQSEKQEKAALDF